MGLTAARGKRAGLRAESVADSDAIGARQEVGQGLHGWISMLHYLFCDGMLEKDPDTGARQGCRGELPLTPSLAKANRPCEEAQVA